MKYRIFPIVLAIVTVLVVGTSSAHAQVVGTVVEPSPPAPTLSNSPIIITAIASDSNGPAFVQLYNNSDDTQDIHDWQLVFAAHDTLNEYELELATFSTWLMPRGHIVISADGAVTGSDYTYTAPLDISTQIAALTERSVRLEPPASQSIEPEIFEITVELPDWQQRKKSTSTGKYLTSLITNTGAAELVGGGVYFPPEDTAGLHVVEISANARDCSPLDTALDCGDYVKLHNTSTAPINMADYRLRTDSSSSKSSSSNTFTLSGLLAPDAYLTVLLKDNNDPLSITNDGGYVWLEDAYGVEVYEPITSYPDMTNKQGQSWAYETATGEWLLMVPAPDAPNYWPPEPPVTVVAVAGASTTSSTSELADCGEGRERNPATNRCRAIVVASTSTLTPCGPGQERNPATNRCRSVVIAASTLTPCGPGQERNPATNRCRSILTAASTTLAPCAPGQERNPETNRCRKVATSALENIASITDVESIEQPSATSWVIAVGAVAAAAAYGIYEWRVDIHRKLKGVRIKRT